MTPPSAYWAHLDRTDKTGLPVGLDVEGRPVAQNFVAASPEVAMEWLRDSVRDSLLDLDTDGFGVAWAWLGDHRAAHRVTASLRQGRPVIFTVTTPSGRWSWSAAPVRALLPLTCRCPAPAPLPRPHLGSTEAAPSLLLFHP
ncbi:hypothetical protein [Streptomyces catenulae]|uniref:Uncharacterized protein n=1 Tax=Streptomyces catenulae TaxID=66875 RepID=A0ABV2Z2H9_9ACTN|nr:hypothetical protein [Streptomyces catenulae]